MTKRRGIDHRQEPSEGSAKNYRVDRVFVPGTPRTTTSSGIPAPIPHRDSAAEIANELLATSRAAPAASEDTELFLRRQLSRLQRQLAESQRELANKDDEVAAEVEKRLELARQMEDQAAYHAQMQAQIDELLAYQARTAGIEERLQDSIATADELQQVNERERAASAAALAKVEEANIQFEATRALWNAERTLIEERSENDLAALDAQRKAAVDASADALNAQAARLREAHEAELAEIRATHEQSLATLRGDLEPKALQAHSLAEERERLIGELAAARNEAIRDVVEIEETHKRETAQLSDAHAAEIATITRNHAADFARATGERDEQIIALQTTVKNAETARTAVAEQAEALRGTLKAVQREAAELKERVAALESDKKSIDEALERGRHVIENLLDDKRQLQEQIEKLHGELRRNADERHRFVAYLEEGLALLGALPPAPDVEKTEAPEAPDPASPETSS